MSPADLLHPLSGTGYQFWSGIGSDLGEITLLGGLAVALRHLNCHVAGCWRHGHVVEGTGYRACNKHHPGRPTNGRVSVATIARAHKRYEDLHR